MAFPHFERVPGAPTFTYLPSSLGESGVGSQEPGDFLRGEVVLSRSYLSFACFHTCGVVSVLSCHVHFFFYLQGDRGPKGPPGPPVS